jgi:hypothetical protein
MSLQYVGIYLPSGPVSHPRRKQSSLHVLRDKPYRSIHQQQQQASKGLYRNTGSLVDLFKTRSSGWLYFTRVFAGDSIRQPGCTEQLHQFGAIAVDPTDRNNMCSLPGSVTLSAVLGSHETTADICRLHQRQPYCCAPQPLALHNNNEINHNIQRRLKTSISNQLQPQNNKLGMRVFNLLGL